MTIFIDFISSKHTKKMSQNVENIDENQLFLFKEKLTNLATTKAMHWGTKWFNFILSVTNKLNITLPT